MRLILVALLLTCATTQAATYQLPTTIEITGYACGSHPEPYVITGTTADGYITGKVYAWTSCSAGGRGAGNSYHVGCAEATWDGNGVLIFYSMLWRYESRTMVATSQCFE